MGEPAPALPTWRIEQGDALERLRGMADGSVHCVVTSPPYYGLRDYGTGEWEGGDPEHEHAPEGGRGSYARPDGASVCACGAVRVDRQVGLEAEPAEYVARMVEVFEEVRRVLREDGTCWLNLGDTFASRWGSMRPQGRGGLAEEGDRYRKGSQPQGFKPKDLIGIPWRVAFALQEAGWWLRSEIIWHKPNPMPESVEDRPTRAHEQVFLLAKSERYFYDATAIREEADWTRENNPDWQAQREETNALKGAGNRNATSGGFTGWQPSAGRNKRSVWTISTRPLAAAHFAVFPPKLVDPCVLAGTSPWACGECGAPWERVTKRKAMEVRPGPSREERMEASRGGTSRTAVNGTMTSPPEVETTGWRPTCEHDDRSGTCVVLDPFAGAGTTGVVALRHGRSFVGVELNPEYVGMARARIEDDQPLLNAAAAR